MEIYFAYGMVSAVMLVITIVFYNLKNWLPVRKNAIYIRLLFFLMIAIFSDLIVDAGAKFFPDRLDLIEECSSIVMCICLMFFFVHLFLYDMAVTGRIGAVKSIWFRLFMGITLLTSVLSVISPILGIFSFLKRSGKGTRGNMIQVAILVVCLLVGIVTLIRNRKELTRQKFYVLLGTQLLLLFDVNMQLVLQARNLASYYTLTGIVVAYYIQLHNVDQFRSLASLCFDGDGFNKVLLERTHYKDDFSCLGICISNIESITNYCTEEEIAGLHRRMGKLLRKNCNRHNVYHVHSFEYIVMFRDAEEAEKKYELLKKVIPSYLRINGKNISILCGFYTVDFADAGYDMTEFNRVIISMRRLTIEQAGRESLLHYRGENQFTIQNELEALCVVNYCISRRRFNYSLVPIQSVSDRNDVSYELIFQETLESGTEISQERIWELAAEAGYIGELGRIAFEVACKAIKEEALLRENAGRLHINLLSSQLANTGMAEEYIQTLKSYTVEGRRVCVELTIDRSVDYDKLVESFAILRNYGIEILLDQFGVTVCSLKNVLNMPFDSVKINHHMVRTFCEGKSGQLVYMVRMLNAQGWKLYLDGINEMSQLDFLSKMQLNYIQGMAVKPHLARDSKTGGRTSGSGAGTEVAATQAVYDLSDDGGGVPVHG